MKKFAAFAAAMLMSVTVWASPTPKCSVTDVKANGTLNATACFGSFTGQGNLQNDLPANVIPVLDDWAFDEFLFGDWALTAKTPTGGPATGLLVNANVTGIFAVSLKASNSWSVYIWETFDTVTTWSYSTIGTAVNGQGKAQDLSHASLWTFTETFVPPPFGDGCLGNPDPSCVTGTVSAPGTLALAGLGLLGAGIVARRRKV